MAAMTTNQLAKFDAALTAYLQPIMHNFIDLQTWAQISAGGVWGASEDFLDRLNKNLDGLLAKHATSHEMSCPGEPWTPTCCISMLLTVKGVDIGFDVILVRSEIVALDFGDEEFLQDLQGVDLTWEFEKMQTFSALSRSKADS